MDAPLSLLGGPSWESVLEWCRRGKVRKKELPVAANIQSQQHKGGGTPMEGGPGGRSTRIGRGNGGNGGREGRRGRRRGEPTRTGEQVLEK